MSLRRGKKRGSIKTASHRSKKTDSFSGDTRSHHHSSSSETQEDTSNEPKVLEELSNLTFAIQRVRDLSLIPPVYHYTVQTGNNFGLSAVDIGESSSELAFAENGSSDIILENFDGDDLLKFESDEDLMTAYRSFKQTKCRSRKKFTPSARSLKGHALSVTGLKFVCSKKILLSCSLDGTVRAWNTEDCRSPELYSAHKLCFSNIDVSRDSSFFATSCLNGNSCLFIFERKEPVKYFIGHSDEVMCVKFHPNGLYVATSSEDKTIKLWTTKNARAVRTFQDDCCPTSLAFSPDAKHLASYSGKYIKIWDLASGQLLSCLADSDNDSSSKCLCFNTYGDILASGGLHKNINLWGMKYSPSETSSNSSLQIPETNLLKCHSLEKKIYLLKFVDNSFFTCVTA